jgi:hypothetical protein
MTFERRNMMIIAIAAISVAALFTFNETDDLAKQSISAIGLPIAEAGAPNNDHTITMEAVTMPDGMYAYRMVSYSITGPNAGDLVADGTYTTKPTIPGPTIVLTEGDTVELTLKNNACDSKFLEGTVGPAEIFNVGVHVHGVHYDITDDATYSRVNMGGELSTASCGDSIVYDWSAGLGTQGTWPYHDHTFSQNEVGAEDVGLFGTVIVNPADQMVKGLVTADGTIVNATVGEIDKEYVLWMVSSEVLGRSVFYGMEIDNGNDGKQTPLWVNPNLYATDGDIVRYHVLGIGDETHAFHLHGHRWVEAQGGSADIIDVKEITPLQRHTFLIQASDNENPINGSEGWMYHCHVFDHMKAGMSGMMIVHPSEDEVDEMPPIGATFTISDEPGLWMKTLDAGVLDDLDEIVEGALGLPLQTISKPGTGFAPKWLGLTKFSEHDFANTEGRSLAILNSEKPSTVLWNMKDSQTKHTITNLIWPAGAELLTVDGNTESLGGMDVDLSVRGSTFLTDSEGRPAMLKDPGLYVFVCKIHPYMFSAVIVDDPSTSTGPTEIIVGLPDVDVPVLDLSPNTTVLTRSMTSGDMSDGNLIFNDDAVLGDYLSTLPSAHPVVTGLVKTFYVVTDPNNWRDYTEDEWQVSLPPVPVTDNDGTTIFLSALDGDSIPNTTFEPEVDGIGEVLVNTQFESTLNKNHPGTPQDKPGTITVVDVEKWKLERKIALPEINMNHPHNMWANAKQDTIYQTQWFDSRMVAIDRESGEMIKDVFVGQSPSHVMTAPSGDNENKIYIAMNGEEQVTELNPVTLEVTRQFSTGATSHPHGHWISSDGTFIVTPNFFNSKSTVVDLVDPNLTKNIDVGFTPIATGMMPDGSKYFTSDFLGNSFTVVDLEDDEVRSIDIFNNPIAPIQGLPVQNPVSPDGKWMVAATVLSHTILVVDVDTEPEEIVAVLPCDPGCHGVQWGAKEGGGYYAYVSNKFSNALIVVDPKEGSNAAVEGKILLADKDTETDDIIIDHAGMGGQGVLAVPNVYNGWIQQTLEVVDVEDCDDAPPKGPKAKGKGPCDPLSSYLDKLTPAQKFEE